MRMYSKGCVCVDCFRMWRLKSPVLFFFVVYYICLKNNNVNNNDVRMNLFIYCI